MIDFIHDVIRKSEIVKYDPWILSTEIALSTIRKRHSRFIKKGIDIVFSDNFSPFNITELATSIGTLEFYNGSKKNTKKFLNRAIISPNDNTSAQIEWLMHIDNILSFNPTDFQLMNNYEALALDNFYNSNWDIALDNAAFWLCDLPFSKRPIILGSHIAGSILDKQKTAREFLRAGLKSHPNDAQLINNLAYSLALENRLDEAEKYIQKVTNIQNIKDSTKICLTATKGIINFRKGNTDVGRKLYLNAIEEAKSKKFEYYNWLAILNFAREELLINSEYSDSIMNAVNLVPDNTKHFEINKLKKEVVDLKNRKSKP
jgi:tetratricopeptide (TPR) repeat protein